MADDDTTLPRVILLALPVPSTLVLLLLTLYHLTPLLALLPNIHLLPLLHRVSTIIPHPRRPRNLPREFFNLPPRPDTPASPSPLDDVTLGVRGKVVLVLSAMGMVSLGAGWGYLAGHSGSWCLVALAAIPLPACISILTLFYLCKWKGGITHSTIFSRILPISTGILGIITAACATSQAPHILLATTSFLTASILVLSGIGGWRVYLAPKGPIQLRQTPSPEPRPEMGRGLEDLRDSDSWLTSPSKSSTINLSSFTYSPMQTPRATRPRTTTINGSPTLWLSSPTTTPSTIPTWEYSPQPAILSASPSRNNLPRPIQPTPAPASKSSLASTHTTMTTPGSPIQSPGGSILAGYEPDPSQPLPRGFESLTSYPLSPSQLAGGGRISVASRVARTADNSAFISEDRTGPSSSTWTLETYCSASETPLTPVSKNASRSNLQTPTERRVPPPPTPFDMPLPPTPTAARSETAMEWEKGETATEWLFAEDWVEVDGQVDALDEWSKEGRGVGLVALFTVVACYGLTVPLLIQGLNHTTQILYLVSILIPAPLLLVTSYLLRYWPSPTTRERQKKSKQSTSTHYPLALLTNSQLSLPISLSPELTPPNHKRSSVPTARLSHILEPRPSLSNFGHNRPRPHTVYGTDADHIADEAMRRTMARRSSDVWIEAGHARQSDGRWSRTAEMLKPVPAMRVLGTERPQHATLTRFRGGVVSMLPKRWSGVESIPLQERLSNDNGMPASPVTIHITSPSKNGRRASGVSYTNQEGVSSSTEIQVATKGRMRSSPKSFYDRDREEGYEIDWMTAGVLPSLVPSIKIGDNVRVGPAPTDGSDATTQHRHTSYRHSMSAARSYSHEQSTSFDLNSPLNFDHAAQSTPRSGMRNRLKHKSSFSLPDISPADDVDVQRSFDDCERQAAEEENEMDRDWDHGVDLPPFPATHRGRDLTPISEPDEPNPTAEPTRMRRTLQDTSILALSLPGSNHTRSRSLRPTPSRLNFSDLAPIIHNAVKSGEVSLHSEEERMAEEMEQILAMDTPTRAEFIISPPPSSYASRPGSRTSHYTTSINDVPPVPGVDAKFSSSGWTTTSAPDTTDQFRDAEEYPLPAVDVNPPLSEIGYYPVPFTLTSHPHPPPLYNQPSVPNLSRPSATQIAAPHPPVAVKTELRALRINKSNDTTTSPLLIRGKEPFKPNRQESLLVKQLKERATAAAAVTATTTTTIPTNRSQSAQGHYVAGSSPNSPSRPLQLVAQRDVNRMSVPLSGKKLAVYDDVKGSDGPKVTGAKSSNTTGRVSKGIAIAKMSTGSGKENVRTRGKASTGSGVVGVRA